ncbi:MAG: cell division protein ZapA [Nitrospirae bacterium]|nr:MAG: cell division protein ZapA [Nitrospirota bacterium]
MVSMDVYILGQKYTIKGEGSEEYIKKVAAFVDAKIKEVYNNAPNITPLKASILASLNIADELHRLKTDRKVQEDIVKHLGHIEESADVLSGLFEK